MDTLALVLVVIALWLVMGAVFRLTRPFRTATPWASAAWLLVPMLVAGMAYAAVGVPL